MGGGRQSTRPRVTKQIEVPSFGKVLRDLNSGKFHRAVMTEVAVEPACFSAVAPSVMK